MNNNLLNFQNYHSGLKEKVLKPMNKKIDIVESVLNSLLYVEDIENTSEIRETANGLTVLDDTPSTVTKIQGNTVQCEPGGGGNLWNFVHTKISGIKSTGRNLIPFPYLGAEVEVPKTINNVTFTVLNDGSVRVQGTASDTVYFNLCRVDFGNTNVVWANTAVNGKFFADVNYDGREGNKSTFIRVDKNVTVDRIYYPMVNIGDQALPFEKGGKESVMALPETLELGKWDYIENGKLYKYTKTLNVTSNTEGLVQDESFDTCTLTLLDMDISESYFATCDDANISIFRNLNTNTFQLWVSQADDRNEPIITAKSLVGTVGNELIIAYKTLSPEIIDLAIDMQYKVWNGGCEIMQLEGEYFENVHEEKIYYSPVPTVTNNYYIKIGGIE